MPSTDPTFFSSQTEFENWLERNHEAEQELLVGFWKTSSDRPSMTWPESVDAALCFGWIDGIRRRVDDESYTIRFTPRRRSSIWSRKNINRITELIEQGSVRPAGHAAFQMRDESKTDRYSFEQAKAVLSPELENTLREAAQAWNVFESQPASYRRAAIWWVISAKREETRWKRLRELIEVSHEGRRLAMLTPTAPNNHESKNDGAD